MAFTMHDYPPFPRMNFHPVVRPTGSDSAHHRSGVGEYSACAYHLNDWEPDPRGDHVENHGPAQWPISCGYPEQGSYAAPGTLSLDRSNAYPATHQIEQGPTYFDYENLNVSSLQYLQPSFTNQARPPDNVRARYNFMQQSTNAEVDSQSYVDLANYMTGHYPLHEQGHLINTHDFDNYQPLSSPGATMLAASPTSSPPHSQPFSSNTCVSSHAFAAGKPVDPNPLIQLYPQPPMSSFSSPYYTQCLSHHKEGLSSPNDTQICGPDATVAPEFYFPESNIAQISTNGMLPSSEAAIHMNDCNVDRPIDDFLRFDPSVPGFQASSNERMLAPFPPYNSPANFEGINNSIGSGTPLAIYPSVSGTEQSVPPDPPRPLAARKKSIKNKRKRPLSTLEELGAYFTQADDRILVKKYYKNLDELAPNSLLRKTMEKVKNPEYPKEKSTGAYQCMFPKCKSKPLQLASAKHHALHHLGNLAHVCSECGDIFLRKRGLTTHQLLHRPPPSNQLV